MEQKETTLTFFSEPDNDYHYQTLLKNAETYSLNTPLSITPFLTCLNHREFSKALRQVCHVGIDYLVEILLAYLQQAKPESKSVADHINEQSSSNNQTALHWAASHAQKTRKIGVLAILLEYDPNPAILDDKGRTYLDYLDEELKISLKSATKEKRYILL